MAVRLSAISERVLDATLALLYPQPCAVCGSSVEARADGAACARCWGETRVFTRAQILCWKCGAPSAGTISEAEPEVVRCRRCEDEAFTAARAVGVYEGALRASVLALKREPFVSKRLAELLHGVQTESPLSAATLIVPVPLHPQRARERGFNQAAELGRALSGLTGLPLDDESLRRATHTERHRALMDERARRESVSDAFYVARPRLIEGESVLLIDDVFTTGATVSACAAALRSAGARRVYVLTLARPV
jgi:ComF family protein